MFVLLLGEFHSLTEGRFTLPNESVTFQNLYTFTREAVLLCNLHAYLSEKEIHLCMKRTHAEKQGP